MCGRYLNALEIDEVIKSYSIAHNEINELDNGEVFPGTNIPIIANINEKITFKKIYWGIKYGGRDIINARFETIQEKSLFKDLIYNKRCIIPASSFFEWKGKEKYEISAANTNITSLGGIYGEFKDNSGNKYTAVVILTTPSNDQMNKIHNRMPLIISEDYKKVWLKGKFSDIENLNLLNLNYNQRLKIKNTNYYDQLSFL